MHSRSPVSTRLVTAVVVGLLAACGGTPDEGRAGSSDVPAAAIPAEQADADLADVTAFRLTMDRVDRYVAAQRSFYQRAAAMTPADREALRARADAEEAAGGDTNSNDDSLDDMIRKVDRTPLMADAIRGAGLSTREYVMTMMTLMQASMAMSVLQMRPNDDADSLAREMKVNPANIAFVKANQAEITQKTSALQAEAERAGVE